MPKRKQHFDHNAISQKLPDSKYLDGETPMDVKARLRRCRRMVREGKFKKADRALDQGKVADLNIHGNWQKTKSKFPRAKPLQIENRKQITPKLRLTKEQVKAVLERINRKSCCGLISIHNFIFAWGIQHDSVYKLSEALWHLARVITTKGVPEPIGIILRYATGVPLGKEKDNECT